MKKQWKKARMQFTNLKDLKIPGRFPTIGIFVSCRIIKTTPKMPLLCWTLGLLSVSVHEVFEETHSSESILPWSCSLIQENHFTMQLL